ncbi:MAG: zinc ribbon domain-containing protein, partial [Theionarchaea archaeon]|nr:zinc ribbon domain-containing protein [Theionarchaea archaeon]
PSEPEEYPPEEPRYQEEPEQVGVPMNILYLIIGALGVIIVLLIVMRRTPRQPSRASGKYCKNCGAPLEPGQAYCSSCGTRVEH